MFCDDQGTDVKSRERAVAAIDALSPNGRAAWNQLLAHTEETAERSMPTKRWSKKAVAFIDAIGDAEFARVMQPWLTHLCSVHKPMYDGDPDHIRGLIWACASQTDETVITAISAVAAHFFEKVRYYGQRATALGNGCLWTLSVAESDAAAVELFRLRSAIDYPSTQLFLEKALTRAATNRNTNVEDLQRTLAASPEELTMGPAKGDLHDLSDADQATTLLAQIYKDPANDELRAVYADRVSSMGDPLGEFINLQYRPEQTRKQRARERALLKQHRDEWLGPLAPILAKSYLVFRRGFPAYGRMKGKTASIKRVIGHPRWSTFEGLDLDTSYEVPLELIFDPIMRSLKRLDGIQIEIVEDILSSSECPALETLGVAGYGLLDEIADMLSGTRLPTIRNLDLTGCVGGQMLPSVGKGIGAWLPTLQRLVVKAEQDDDSRDIQEIMGWQQSPPTVELCGKVWNYTITRNGESRLLVAEPSAENSAKNNAKNNAKNSAKNNAPVASLLGVLSQLRPGLFTGLRVHATDNERQELAGLADQMQLVEPVVLASTNEPMT